MSTFEKSIALADVERLELVGGADSVTRATIVLGANPACCQHLDGVGVPCVLYLRTSKGVRGTGAHPGFVVEMPETELVKLGFATDAIMLAAGANVADRKDSTGPVCSECLSYVGERAPRLRIKGRACWSCSQMIRESWESAAQARECDQILASEVAAVAS